MTDSENEQQDRRPLKFQKVEDLDRAISAYFDICDPHTQRRVVDCGISEKCETIWREREVMTEQKPYTMAGLARALGISRQGLLDYSQRDDFLDLVAAAKQRCEEYWEGLLASPYSNGAKFNLTNNYKGKHQDWADQHAVDHTTKGQPMPLLGGTTPMVEE